MYYIKLYLSRSLLAAIYFICKLLQKVTRTRKLNDQITVALTGTFYSDNWIKAHIFPLAGCHSVKTVYLVTHGDFTVPENVSIVKPGARLTGLFGEALSRLITLFLISKKSNVDFVGGFHLLFNATFARIISSLIGARSIYFCVGGVTETLSAGKTENRFFSFIRSYDKILTNYLIKIAALSDLIITMGSGAKNYFICNGVDENKIHIISGAIDSNRFQKRAETNKDYDLILTARLTEVKWVDKLVEIVACLKINLPKIKAVVVGDGPLMQDLKNLAAKTDVANNIDFIGSVSGVEKWLNRSRIFILTSRSEGLSLALMEALSCGLPAVVPNVGDLSDAIENGKEGFLIQNHNIEEFVDKINKLLNNEARYNEFSEAAILRSHAFDIKNMKRKWDDAFSIN
jgi:glycosyltransferase involved in cell wall biosynthesis